MEPNSNLPETNNNPVSNPSEHANHSANPQAFSHEKIITPINSDIKPEEPTTPVGVAPVPANNLPSTTPALTQPAQPSTAAEPMPPTNSAQQEPEWKPTNSLRKNLLEALFVFTIAAAAGAVFHLWYRLVVKILPNSVSFCSNTDHNAISFACHGTLFGNFFTFITLFSFASYLSYRLLKKSNTLAFYYGGFFVASLFFLETALVFDFQATYKLRWLFVNSPLWNNWLTPALVSGIFTLAFYALIKYTVPLVKTILGFLYVGIIALSLIFMPSLVNNFVSQQSNKGSQEVENQVIENVKNSDIKLYAPKNYPGPLKLSSVQALIANPDLIPRYELFYNFSNLHSNQSWDTIVHIYKGSANDFNPPANCGDGSPSSEKYKSTLTYPCKVVLKTKRGRAVYGYLSPSKLQYYKIDPNSDDIKKIQPDIFYIPMGEDVISFSDPASNEDDKSPLTPAVIKEFVDSLEPLTSTELEQFINHYILLKS